MTATFDPKKLSVAEQVAVLQNLRQAAAAVLMGIEPRTIRDKEGVIPRNRDGTYSGPAMVAWAVSQAGETAADPELAGPDSPALERFREARAALAEFELQLKQGDLMKRADVHEGLSMVGSIIRTKVIRLVKLFGPEAGQIMREAVEDMLKANERLFGDQTEPGK